MHRLRHKTKTKAGRLLRVLLLRVGAVPAGSGRALGRERRGLVLRGIGSGTDTDASTRDWLRSPRASLLAWWVPHAAIVASLLAPVPVRAAIWIVALIWMGLACILNAKVHRNFLSGHDCAGVSACRHKLRRISGLALPRCFHSRGRQDHLVGHGARLGKILIVKHTIRSGCGTSDRSAVAARGRRPAKHRRDRPVPQRVDRSALRPRTPISIGFAEGLAPSDAHWALHRIFPSIRWATMSRDRVIPMVADRVELRSDMLLPYRNYRFLAMARTVEK